MWKILSFCFYTGHPEYMEETDIKIKKYGTNCSVDKKGWLVTEREKDKERAL